MKFYITTDEDVTYGALTEEAKYVGTNETQALEAAENEDYVYVVNVIEQRQVAVEKIYSDISEL